VSGVRPAGLAIDEVRGRGGAHHTKLGNQQVTIGVEGDFLIAWTREAGGRLRDLWNLAPIETAIV
jgi:hypothetical protein